MFHRDQLQADPDHPPVFVEIKRDEILLGTRSYARGSVVLVPAGYAKALVTAGHARLSDADAPSEPPAPEPDPFKRGKGK